MKLERTQTKTIGSEDGENIYIEILDHVEYEDMYGKTKEEARQELKEQDCSSINKKIEQEQAKQRVPLSY
jgi:hypothetical protein